MIAFALLIATSLVDPSHDCNVIEVVRHHDVRSRIEAWIVLSRYCTDDDEPIVGPHPAFESGEAAGVMVPPDGYAYDELFMP